jgi:GT2 family glycosyltransferase
MLSVVIPTYRRKESLFSLLDHLSKQSLKELEVILIDQNGEGFFSEDELRHFNWVRRVHMNTPNASAARNQGYRVSNGTHILFLDDDLLPDRDFCKKGLEIFNRYADVKCFSPLVYNVEGRDKANTDADRKISGRHGQNQLIISITDTMCAAVFIEKDYFRRTGGFHEPLFEFAKTAEDQEFFLRMNMMGMKVWIVKEISIFHDESNPGGCDLRTADYWITREKCMKAWAYRYRLHNRRSPGEISMTDFFQMCRSSFLNRDVLFSGWKNIKRQYKLMQNAVYQSKGFYQLHSELMANLS